MKKLTHITDLGRRPDRSMEAVLQKDLFRPFENEVKRNYASNFWKDGESRDLCCLGVKPDSTRNFGNALFFVPKYNYLPRPQKISTSDDVFETRCVATSSVGTVDLIAEQRDQLQKVDRQQVRVQLPWARRPIAEAHAESRNRQKKAWTRLLKRYWNHSYFTRCICSQMDMQR